MLIYGEFYTVMLYQQVIKDKKSTSFQLVDFLARHAGFEPATYRFVAGHSIH